MKNNYFPEIFKVKIKQSIRYLYSLFFFTISILSSLALLTFDINDNSFLTSTSNESQNLLGDTGSYFASFIFYTFGLLGYLIIFFFIINAVLILLKRPPTYIFIKLLLFFISLIIIPQTFIDLGIKFKFIESIEEWGVFSIHLYALHEHNYVSYILSIFGILIYFFSQNILNLFNIQKINFIEVFKIQKKNQKLKKILEKSL